MKEIAKERIKILLKNAEKEFRKNPSLAKRYIFIAKKIAMKSNIKLSSEQKRKICKGCGNFILPGVNCKVRTNPKTKCVEYICDCKNINRHGYSKEKFRVKTFYQRDSGEE